MYDIFADNRESNPQTLLFSATVPHWVRDTSKKYLSRDLKMIDLIGRDSNRTAVNVKVRFTYDIFTYSNLADDYSVQFTKAITNS